MAVDAEPGHGLRHDPACCELPAEHQHPRTGTGAEQLRGQPDGLAASSRCCAPGVPRSSYGNLLTLPVGGGLLYVEPVYVQASSGSASYPLLQKVLVAFGDQHRLRRHARRRARRGRSARPSDAGQRRQRQRERATATPAAATRTWRRRSPTRQAGDRPTRDAALKAGDFAAYGDAQKRARGRDRACGRGRRREINGDARTPRPAPSRASPAPAQASSPSPSADGGHRHALTRPVAAFGPRAAGVA